MSGIVQEGKRNTFSEALMGVELKERRGHYCLVLVGSRNGFERDFTIELK